jgi:RNA polymerase sigma-70 factor (ECF subfamily)
MDDKHDLNGLMERAAKGDQNAFRELASHLGQRIFLTALRLLNGDRAAAEDASQTVLIKLWQNAPNWEPRGSVSAYVSRLTYSSCMDLHRKKVVTTELPDTLHVEESATVMIFEKERRKILLKMLDRLPERQREAILLTYFHEEKRSDVAKALHTTEKAVEHLVARGIKALGDIVPASLKENDHGRHEVI